MTPESIVVGLIAAATLWIGIGLTLTAYGLAKLNGHAEVAR